MHETLFADFVAAFHAAQADETQIGLDHHSDNAQALFRRLIETPTRDMTGVMYQLAAGQVWEGEYAGGTFKDDAAAAVYRNTCKATGLDPLASIT